ncbi:MAG: hypothetical protein ACKPKO_14295, partial [Candidatus Fonsibacter sp.]
MSSSDSDEHHIRKEARIRMHCIHGGRGNRPPNAAPDSSRDLISQDVTASIHQPLKIVPSLGHYKSRPRATW